MRSKYAHDPKFESRIQIPLSKKQLDEISDREKELAKRPKKTFENITILPPVGEVKEKIVFSRDIQEVKRLYNLCDTTLLSIEKAVETSLTVDEAVFKFIKKEVMGQSLATEIITRLMSKREKEIEV